MKTMKNTSRIVPAAALIGLVALAGLAVGQEAPATPKMQPPAQAQPGAAAPAVPAPAPTGPHPTIVLEKTDHEFGRISDEQKITAEFPFRNTGDAPLIFKDQPRASCGCTAGKLEKLEYAPGEGGKFTVTFDPHGKHGDQNQRIIANTNDPANPEVICKFHSLVRPTIVIDPPLIGFGEVLAGTTAKQTVHIKGPKDFAVTYASNTKGRYVTTRVLSTQPIDLEGEPGSESVVEYTLLPNAPRGTLQALSTARTTNDKHPLVDVQLTAEVVGDLQVLPPRLNVGVVDPGTEFTKTFKVSSRGDRPFKIKSVTQKSSTTPAPLLTTVTPAEPGKETAYTVEVRGQAPQAGTPMMATLAVLAEQNGAEETMDVAVNGVVRMPTPPPGMTVQPAAPGGVFQPPAAPTPPPAPAPTSDTQPTKPGAK
jgi:hypothetical protein